MNCMKKLILASSCCLCMAVAQFAQADPVGTKAVDKTAPVALAAGLQTCNVYVQFDNPADVLLSVGFANLVVAGSVPNATNTDGGLYQDLAFGGDLPPNNAFCAVFPLLCSDSFVTIGTKNASTALSTDPDWNGPLFNTIGGGSGVAGGWFAVPQVPPLGTPDANLQVLIAQFTVTQGGSVTGTLTAFYGVGTAFPTVVSCFGVGPCVGEGDCDPCETCVAGACVPNPGEACDDGLFCNGADSCGVDLTCSVHAGDPCLGGPDCNNVCNEVADNCFVAPGMGCTSDGNQCTTDACDGAGTCAHNAVPNNTACGSSSTGPCDAADNCQGGVCQTNTSPDGAACNDGVFCNGADTCSAGACSNHAGDPCTGGAQCNNACNEVADNCFNASGTACTGNGVNQCSGADTCNGSGTCSNNNSPNGTGCDDGLACNIGETCQNGACSGGGANSCNDGDACTTDSCSEPAGCANVPIVCPPGQSCVGGVCIFCQTNTDCDDGVACTVDVCDPGTGCSNTPDDAACDDGDVCTSDSCDAIAGCVYANNDGAACDDGNGCTSGDTCSGGACGGTPDCTTDADCDAGAGEVCTAAGCCAAPGVDYALDIKEKKCPNKFKLTTGNGHEKIYIVGDADSDVHLIDLTTIRLRLCGGSDSIPWDKEPRFKDKVGPHFTECGDCSCAKLKKDYIDDIEVKFNKGDISALIGDVPNGTLVDIEVYGNLLDSTPFTAHDCVLVQRPNSYTP